jgi:predicted XRE-type DNA-binding protein
MAIRGKPLDAATLRQIEQSALSLRQAARALGVAVSTVQKYRKHLPK